MKLNNLVKSIIEENKISKQSDITDILLNKFNINITQSNISRILKQIKAVKIINGNKNIIYEIQEKLDSTSNWMKKLVKKIDDNGSNIIVVTYSGAGNIISQAIDEKNFNNIMGTVSGDNTILILPKDILKIAELKKELEIFLL